MPFESSLPLVMACLLGAVGVFVAWLRVPSRGLLAFAAVLAVAGIGAGVADALVETDREHLLALFPRLARAAEQREIGTIIAALDPDLHPLRKTAEQVLAQVRPTEVAITGMDVVVDPAKTPPEAVAHLTVRVQGNVIDKGTPSTVLAGVRVVLHKKGAVWLVTDAEGEKVRPGQRPE